MTPSSSATAAPAAALMPDARATIGVQSASDAAIPAPIVEAAAAATDIGNGGTAVAARAPRWSAEGEQELKKIPFFVRGKARRNTETYAAERGIDLIGVETLYEAKAHFGR